VTLFQKTITVFVNFITPPSVEGLCLDKKKRVSMLQLFFSICGTTFQNFFQRLRLKVSIQMEKKYNHDLICFSICGINFSNIFAAPQKTR
jgi:hypothetical protein